MPENQLMRTSPDDWAEGKRGKGCPMGAFPEAQLRGDAAALPERLS